VQVQGVVPLVAWRAGPATGSRDKCLVSVINETISLGPQSDPEQIRALIAATNGSIGLEHK